MAGVDTKPKTRARSGRFPDRLCAALTEGLGIAGIRGAAITAKRIPPTRLHRVTIEAKAFAPLGFSERQDLVWRIIDRAFSPEDQLRISMILTLTPEEAQNTPEPQ